MCGDDSDWVVSRALVTDGGCDVSWAGEAALLLTWLLVITRTIFWSMAGHGLNETRASPSCLPSGILITVANFPSYILTEAMTAFGLSPSAVSRSTGCVTVGHDLSNACSACNISSISSVSWALPCQLTSSSPVHAG